MVLLKKCEFIDDRINEGSACEVLLTVGLAYVSVVQVQLIALNLRWVLAELFCHVTDGKTKTYNWRPVIESSAAMLIN